MKPITFSIHISYQLNAQQQNSYMNIQYHMLPYFTDYFLWLRNNPTHNIAGINGIYRINTVAIIPMW